MRQSSRALALATADRERALAHEAVGDAQWMAERSDDAWGSYRLARAAGMRAALIDRYRRLDPAAHAVPIFHNLS